MTRRSFPGLRLWAAALLLPALAACAPPLPAVSPTPTREASPSPIHTAAFTATPTAVPPGATASLTPTPIPTPSATPTITPTYAILRGEVLVRANCRYGPGAPYLYKYGLVPGSNLEIYGRTDSGSWLLVRAIGGTNPCWVKASLMAPTGDVMSVAPAYIPLPQSPYYAPPRGVSAVRRGDEVSVFWSPMSFRAGDETASPPYLIEAWVCLDGEIVFTPLGSYEAAALIRDEAGCSEPSHGRLYGVEKHGYTRPVEIPWP